MQKAKKYEERLMETFDFSEDDLDVNRMGQLSRRQAVRLNKQRQTQVLGATGILIVGIFTVLVIFGVVSAARMTYQALSTLAGLSLFFLLPSWIIWSRASKLINDLQRNRVAIIEGLVDLSVQGVQTANYLLHVGDTSFTVKQKMFLAFKNGDPYRIYYTPHSQQILSVEWLRENDDNLLDEGESRADDANAATPDQQQLSRPR